METITSLTNHKIKDTVKLQQKKFRVQTGLFLLEGYKPIFEAKEAGIEIQVLFTLEKNLSKFNFLKDKITLVNEAVLEKISTTDSMPEAVAVGVQKKCTLAKIQKGKRLVILQNIKDAGNLGTIIRSALAFGMDGIILQGDTIDIYNPKVVRSAVGALFKIDIVKIDQLEDFDLLGKNLIATVLNHNDIVDPKEIDFSKPFVIMLGSEADGLDEKAINVSNIKTTIPISNKTESLNLSSAAAVMFYIAS